MQKLFFVILAISAIDLVSSQCGCSPSKLLKRDMKNLQMGDMLLDKAHIALMNGFRAHDASTKRWPNGQVLYWLQPNFPEKKKAHLRQALDELQNDLKGCIKFEESKSSHYISVTSSPAFGCVAQVGYVAGENQILNLASPGCLYSKGTIKHEFIHALGFFHTHNRKDRNEHIDIKWERLASKQCQDFKKCEGCELDGPYETTSVMHYGSTTFACVKGEKVVFKKDGGIIEYNHDTTPNDIDMIRRFYQC